MKSMFGARVLYLGVAYHRVLGLYLLSLPSAGFVFNAKRV
jgi:hypothetical protein